MVQTTEHPKQYDCNGQLKAQALRDALIQESAELTNIFGAIFRKTEGSK
jgi:hypothetical protein